MGSSEKVPNGCLTTASDRDDTPFDLLRDFYASGPEKHYINPSFSKTSAKWNELL